MATNTESVRDHHQAGIEDETKLLAKLNRIIDEMEPPPTAEKFAGFDQFHVGGLAATVELAKRSGITRHMRVLDAGSGLGGPSRFLAETIGCHITGAESIRSMATAEFAEQMLHMPSVVHSPRATCARCISKGESR